MGTKLHLTTEWIIGFVDRAASFFVHVEEKDSYLLGARVRPEFRIVQSASERELLLAVMEFFEYGTIRRNKSNQLEYRVRGLEELADLVNFFLDHPLRSKQQHNVVRFSKILEILQREDSSDHLKKAEMDRILAITKPIMRPAKRGIRS